MEPIDEQWNPEPAMNIMSRSWPNIIDAKKAVKTWILDRGESWGPSNESNKIRLLLHCVLSTCEFYIRIACRNNGLFGITSYIPHNCSPSTHAQFKPRSSAWYIASRLERDITTNRHIKPKEI